ncbi:hypothetical protein Z043_100098, partial [Scleropages formosus]
PGSRFATKFPCLQILDPLLEAPQQRGAAVPRLQLLLPQSACSNSGRDLGVTSGAVDPNTWYLVQLTQYKPSAPSVTSQS